MSKKKLAETILKIDAEIKELKAEKERKAAALLRLCDAGDKVETDVGHVTICTRVNETYNPITVSSALTKKEFACVVSVSGPKLRKEVGESRAAELVEKVTVSEYVKPYHK